MLVANAKIQYFFALLCGEKLNKFDMLSSEVGIITSENWKSIILGLSGYFSG